MLDFSPSELEYLTALLERDHHTLQFEICHTDHREFKKLLQAKQELCERMLDKVARQTARSAA